VTIVDTRVEVRKGDRIRAKWFAHKVVGLAGVQMKVSGEFRIVTGVVRHIRTNDPQNPTDIRLYLDPEGDCNVSSRVNPLGCECPTFHVEIMPDWVEAKL
jgi:hypothetical protein